MEALYKVQAELKAPKGQYNAFGKYKYRSCEDILEAVKPLLAKHKLTLTLSDQPVEIGGHVYIEATASITDGTHVVAVKAYAREPETKKGMDDSQITGAASSYARKYALNGLFLIDDTADADATNDHQSGIKPTKKQTAKAPTQKPATTPKQAAEALRKKMLDRIGALKTKCVENGVAESGLVEYASAKFGCGEPQKLTDEQLIDYGKYLAQMEKDSQHLKEENA